MIEVSFDLEIGNPVQHSTFGMKGIVRGLFLDRDQKQSVFVEYKSVDGKVETDYWRVEDIEGTKPFGGE